MQFVGVRLDAVDVAGAQGMAERGQPGLDGGEPDLELRGMGRGGQGPAVRQGHQLFALPSNSCAFAMSLSAITSGWILKVPLEMASLTAATLPASNSLEPLDSSVDAVLDSATVALASGVPMALAGAAPADPTLVESTRRRSGCRRPAG